MNATINDNRIHYSRGTNTFDNSPVQRVATTFDEFESTVLADRSPAKGLTFICAPFRQGLHYQNPSKNPGLAHWRLKNYVEPRTFLPFDFDGFDSAESFTAMLEYLKRYRGFGYTTASSTPDAPRARAILLASRPVTRDECVLVCKKVQAAMIRELGNGAIKFDTTVYRGEQPIYTPVHQAEAFRFNGITVDVDALLASAPDQPPSVNAAFCVGLGGYIPPEHVTDGEGRESSILSYAGHLRGKGLDQPTIDRILLDYNVAHIIPPLDDETVLDRARRYEGHAAAANDPDWPVPEEIAATLPPVPPFDMHLLPPAFHDWVGDIAERMQCPVDYLAVGAMVAAGAVVGNRIGIQPKRHDTGWVEVPNVWGAIIGRPGLMKSPALSKVLAPLRRIEAKALEDFGIRRARHAIDRLQYEAAMKKIEADIKKTPHLRPDALPPVPDEPQPPRLLLNDATYQKLGEVLSGSPHGLMVFQDELSGLLARLDADGQEAARAFYLEAWNGQQGYTFDRIGRGTIRIPRLCFSLLGGLQPSKLREYLRSAVYGGKGDDGLAQRLQLLVYPDPPATWINVDRHPDMAAVAAAEAVFDRLAAIDPVQIGARIPFDGGIPVLGFDEQAQQLFDAWRTRLENALRQGDHPPALESHLSKYRKLVPTLALLDHLIADRSGSLRIDSLKRAIGWQLYLMQHAQRAYAAVTSATLDSAKALSSRIRQGALNDGFTARDVYRKNWSMLATSREAGEALSVLVDLGWLRAVQDVCLHGGDGRPTVRYYINPLLQVAA